jgi:putative transposase
MDESHFVNAARYIEWNPVRAGLVENPEDYRWSSARAHLQATDDGSVAVRPLLEIVGDWRFRLGDPLPDSVIKSFRRSEKTGRPLGSDEFVAGLEALTGRVLRKQKAGRPPKGQGK